MNIKLPSVHYLVSSAETAFLRFPLTIVSAVIAAGCALLIIESETSSNYTVMNLMLTAALGIPVYTGVALLTQRPVPGARYYYYAGATLVLILVFMSLPEFNSTFNRYRPYFRYAVYNAAAHLLVAVAPYFQKGELNGFWNYNKSLFLRILLSLLYSLVMYAGLALSIFTVDELFNAEIDPRLFAEVFVVITYVFNTWFFVAGLPAEFDELQRDTRYPRGLKVFCQYVLVPLIVIYLVILYIYGGKIMITWNWPEGLVSYLIMVISVAGILTMLLLYPYSENEDGHWIKSLRKAFYLLLIPLVIMLFLAIGIRINTYGFTVNRYLILLTGIWISMAAIYSLVRPRHIKFLPASLGILYLLCSFGYWGMFSVSERDQTDRLETILSENGLLENGKIVNEVKWDRSEFPEFKSPDQLINNLVLSDSLHNEVISILEYLDDYHGFNSIESWFEQDIDGLIKESIEADNDTIRAFARDEKWIFAESMGLSGYTKVGYDNIYLTFVRENDQVLSLDGYRFMVNVPSVNFTVNRRFPDDSSGLINLDWDEENFHIDYLDTIRFDISFKMLKRDLILHSGTIDPDNEIQFSTIRYENQDKSSVLVVRQAGMIVDKMDTTINRIQVDILTNAGRTD